MSAKRKTIGVAVIGAGGRGQYCTATLLTDSWGHVQVRSVYDPDRAMSEAALENGTPRTPSSELTRLPDPF